MEGSILRSEVPYGMAGNAQMRDIESAAKMAGDAEPRLSEVADAVSQMREQISITRAGLWSAWHGFCSAGDRGGPSQSAETPEPGRPSDHLVSIMQDLKMMQLYVEELAVLATRIRSRA